MNAKPEAPFLTVAQASRLMFPNLDPARARRKAYRWASLGALPSEVAFKVGAAIVFRQSALREWLVRGFVQNGQGEAAQDN